MEYDVSENATPEELRIAKQCAPTKEGFVRFQAVELLLGGYEKEDVARISDRSIRTIERWALEYARRGIDGVALKGRSGRPRKISQERFSAEIVPLVLEPAKVGETHWTGVKLHGYLVKELHEQLCYRTVLNYLHEQSLSRVMPRSWPERQDPEARACFCAEIAQLKQDQGVELWYGDETGIEGDPRPRKVWVKKGTRPKAPYLGDHLRINVVGAVAPERGDFFSLIIPYADTDVFQVFLDHLAEHTKHSTKRIVLVLDNASWHRAATLHWHHLEPKFLPAYSPDLNPIEVLWLALKQQFFSSWFAPTLDALIERTSVGLRSFIAAPHAVSSITSF